MTPTHTDPPLPLYIEYTAIAEQLELLRVRGTQLIERLPPAFVQSAGMLSYHLRQAYKEARLLAGERPEDVKPPASEVKQQGA